jgi:tetratricopeptide (TPR) repeat protein
MSTPHPELARLAFLLGDFHKSIELCTDGTLRAEENANQSELLSFRRIKAEILNKQGRYQEALSLFEDSLASQSMDAESLVHVQCIRGFALTQLGQYGQACHAFVQAENLAREAEIPVLTARIKLHRASFFFYLGDYAASGECTRHAFEIAERENDRLLRACAVGGMGKYLMVCGKYAEAIPWFERALEIFLEEDARFLASGMKSELGWCHFNLGADDKALDLFSRALDISLRAGAKPSIHIDFANTGNVYLRRGEYSAAIEHYQKALAIARELNDSICIAKWLGNLALTYSRMGSPALAKMYELEAERVNQKVAQARAAAAS